MHKKYKSLVPKQSWKFVFSDSQITSNRFQIGVITSLWLTRGPSLTSFFDGCMYLYTAHVTYHVSRRFTILLSEID